MSADILKRQKKRDFCHYGAIQTRVPIFVNPIKESCHEKAENSKCRPDYSRL